ncbi:ADP-ribosylation factor-like protein 6-interacting protein 6 isoform X2 [Thalassophryne amazonica]|uniref:ADP-ribosylation factor-like protein 6-interacting protein 6 isoform X2 n=1 Tax=Thalassophryne amazonica TaxID=390379 RepID=UPI001471D965|nr:ADP-ribosylation factor-like protein 6-interacting protein 6 isoform X2 [Thalassophryne amazonica]
MVTEEPRATGSPPLWTQKCRKPWTVVVLSALCSAVSVAAVGSVAAFLYPILRDLRAERVTRQDGTEVRMLGFWSIMVVSLSAGCVCSIFSWIIIYLDSYQPGMVITKPRFLSYFRRESEHGFHLGYCVAVLNGIMATLTVLWSLR